MALTPQTVDFRPGDPRYWEPLDFYEYSGPRTGTRFVAREGLTYTAACGIVTWETTVTGTFSDDGSHLTAQQVDSFNVGDTPVGSHLLMVGRSPVVTELPDDLGPVRSDPRRITTRSTVIAALISASPVGS